ncbi:MAG: DPP IV N-terminal domain-containing protein [Bacteroides sp.]|nr:DPP IV N-terminal domain-containing protein [Bacteroides sp.]
MTITSAAIAQEKKSFTLEDLMPGGNNYYNLQPKNLHGLTWWGDVCIKPGMEEVKAVNPKTGKETTLFTLEALNKALEAAGVNTVRALYTLSYPWADKAEVQLPKAQRFAVYNWKTGAVITRDDLPKEPYANVDLDTESGNIAYTVKNNLYVNGFRVTDEPEGVLCGQSVHRNEFGIEKGTFWNPQGSLLAFYRMDQSMVTDYPQVNTSTRVATLEPDKYPMAGMTSHKVTVGIYNPSTKGTVYLKAGDPTDRYFTNISWSPDGQKVYMIELNRDQNHAELCRYDATTGDKEAILYEEKHDKYVEPQHPIVFLPWNEHQFIYQSQRDGYNHLYLFDLSKGMMHPIETYGPNRLIIPNEPLTQGEWLVKDILGFNEKAKEVIIMSTEQSPLQSNVYAVNVKTGQRRPIGAAEGVHRAQLSAGGTYVIDNYTSHNVARNISIQPTTGKGKAVELLSATNPMDEYNLPEITLGTIKAADGKTDLYYRLVKPVNFDASKKYPAVIYVYGGPHAQLITDVRNYGAGGWDIYMAQLGYVMLTVDNRGSANRGLEFENCTHRQLGTEEMKDQMKGVELLKSLGYVDENRIGVHGWSFGGFMTTNLMLTYNDTFKVGVAGGPVIDWKMYEVMYGERYMDTPESNSEGYKKADLTQRAGDLKGRLQIIIGANDPVCVPQHSIRFLRACIDAGTQPDYFIYPGDGHNMFGRDRVHLYTRITRYFEDYLK